MDVDVAVSNSAVPLSFIAWGSYTVGDSPTSGNLTMTITSEELRPTVAKNFAIAFDGSGTWTAAVSGLTGGTYNLDASYTTSGGGTVSAPQQTNIQAASGNPQPPLPPSVPASSPGQGKPIG